MPCATVKNASVTCRPWWGTTCPPSPSICLSDSGIVTRRKQGVNIYYSLALCCLDQFLACTGQLLEKRILSQMDMLRNK